MQNISQAVRVCSRALRSMQTFTTFLCVGPATANKGGDTNFKNTTVSIILCKKFWVASCYGNKNKFTQQNLQCRTSSQNLNHGIDCSFKNVDYNAVHKQDTRVNLHELNKVPFCLSLVLNFWSITLHRPAVIC